MRNYRVQAGNRRTRVRLRPRSRPARSKDPATCARPLKSRSPRRPDRPSSASGPPRTGSASWCREPCRDAGRWLRALVPRAVPRRCCELAPANRLREVVPRGGAASRAASWCLDRPRPPRAAARASAWRSCDERNQPERCRAFFAARARRRAIVRSTAMVPLRWNHFEFGRGNARTSNGDRPGLAEPSPETRGALRRRLSSLGGRAPATIAVWQSQRRRRTG
jgi:hypothetical protein